MSDENVPKLRLKPKLSTESSADAPTPATPANPAADPAPAVTSGDGSPKLVRLKPKLAPAPVQAETPVDRQPEPLIEAPAPAAEPVRLRPRSSNQPAEGTVATPVSMPEPVAPESEGSPTPAPESAAKPFKLGLKPKAASAGPAPEAPPMVSENEQPPTLEAPPPPAVSIGAEQIETAAPVASPA